MAETSMYIGEDLIEAVDEIAHERSSPGNRVSRSEVFREAVQEYVNRHYSDRNGAKNDEPSGDA